MLKFKLSLLLNNTKFKVAMAVLLLTAIVTGLVFIPKNKAGNISSTVSAMANSSGVTLNGTTVYKIEKDGSGEGASKKRKDHQFFNQNHGEDEYPGCWGISS